jgi:hypothetical protein
MDIEREFAAAVFSASRDAQIATDAGVSQRDVKPSIH